MVRMEATVIVMKTTMVKMIMVLITAIVKMIKIYNLNNCAWDLLQKQIFKNFQKLFEKLSLREKNVVEMLLNYPDIWVNITTQYYEVAKNFFS